MGTIELSMLTISFPNRMIRAHAPPTANHPIPLLSMTAPGSKGTLQSPNSGLFPSMRLLSSGLDHGPTGEVEVSTAVPTPPLEK